MPALDQPLNKLQSLPFALPSTAGSTTGKHPREPSLWLPRGAGLALAPLTLDTKQSARRKGLRCLGRQEPPPSRTRRQDAAVAAGYHRAPCRRTGAALRLHHRQPLARGQWTLHRPLAELQHVLIRKRPPLFLVVGERVAAVGPGHHDPVHHLQCPLPVPVLLPALHPHQGRPLLHHGSLPDPGWSVRDERGGHLHGAAHGVASQLGLLLRLRLHPGLGGLPAGPPQRRSLRDLAETRMRHPDPVRARVCACVRGSELTQAREERNQKLRKKLKALAPTAPSESKPNRKQLLSIEDVYNIYGL
uniref:Uncharacterized protein n=1 Tax=Oryctolagus cuniculus TaxID=9986 RepID=A0A5F9C4R1_RABIT